MIYLNKTFLLLYYKLGPLESYSLTKNSMTIAYINSDILLSTCLSNIIFISQFACIYIRDIMYG